MDLKDFTPTKENISLHGLGFIQIVLPRGQRMHVWHPNLPRRKCFEHSAIHNHRFGFVSRVLKGIQRNVRADIEIVRDGTHELISHNGPRSEKGGRLSYPVADCNVILKEQERIYPGDSYHMKPLEFHFTPVDGIVITVIHKTIEGMIHANSVCKKGVDFDYDFDRFQLSRDDLYSYVVDAFMASDPEPPKDPASKMATCQFKVHDHIWQDCGKPAVTHENGIYVCQQHRTQIPTARSEDPRP